MQSVHSPPVLNGQSLETLDHYLSRLGPAVRGVIERMEAVEPWAIDRDAEIEPFLKEWVDGLTEDEVRDLATAPTTDLVVVLGFVSLTRSLHLTHLLGVGENDPGQAKSFLQAARSVAAGHRPAVLAYRVLLGRLSHLARRQHLQRIYNPRRAQAIAAALEELA